MQFSTRTVSIAAATVISIGMVLTAFLLSGSGASVVSAVSTQEILKAYAAKDTDSDGLPDWQEDVYGTDPKDPESVEKGVNDKDAVDQGLVKPRFVSDPSARAALDTSVTVGIDAEPTTLTEQFARAFFGQYLLAQEGQGEEPSSEALATFVEGAVQDLTEANRANPPYKLSNIRTSGAGPDALRQYMAGADAALVMNTVNTEKSEVEYFADAVQQDDAAALKKVAAIARAYEGTAKALVNVSVPSEAASAHLAVVNSFARTGSVIKQMAAYKEDPVLALVGLGQYEEAVGELVQALGGLKAVLAAENVSFAPGEPGYQFYSATQTP